MEAGKFVDASMRLCQQRRAPKVIFLFSAAKLPQAAHDQTDRHGSCKAQQFARENGNWECTPIQKYQDQDHQWQKAQV